MQGAIEEDKKQNYEEAYKLYSNALDYFMLALKCMLRLHPLHPHLGPLES